MDPVNFPQANTNFHKPADMTDDECSPLPVAKVFDGKFPILISCFKPTWKERLALFFGKPVWLGIVGQIQPPVWLVVNNPFED